MTTTGDNRLILDTGLRDPTAFRFEQMILLRQTQPVALRKKTSKHGCFTVFGIKTAYGAGIVKYIHVITIYMYLNTQHAYFESLDIITPT